MNNNNNNNNKNKQAKHITIKQLKNSSLSTINEKSRIYYIESGTELVPLDFMKVRRLFLFLWSS